jgi:hypothetical protein
MSAASSKGSSFDSGRPAPPAGRIDEVEESRIRQELEKTWAVPRGVIGWFSSITGPLANGTW